MATVDSSKTRSGAPRGAASQMRCQVITPEKTLMDAEVTFVAVPLIDGEMGILPGRAPVVARLGFGELRYDRAGAPRERLYVDGGFLQIRDNQISVLTNRALSLTDLTADSARAELERALAISPTTPEQFAERDRAVARARAQLRLAEAKGSL